MQLKEKLWCKQAEEATSLAQLSKRKDGRGDVSESQ